MKNTIVIVASIISLTACGMTNNESIEQNATVLESAQVDTADESKEETINEPPKELETDEGEEAAEENMADTEKADEEELEEAEYEPFREVLGHKPEYGRFTFATHNPRVVYEFFLNSDGSFKGSLSEIQNNMVEQISYAYLADFEGKFELGEEIDYKTYSLILEDFKVTSTPGESIDESGTFKNVYLDELEDFSTDKEYKLLLRGLRNEEIAQRMEYIITGTESKGYMDRFDLKTNVIVGPDNWPVFAEIIDYENVGDDFDIFQRLKGKILNSNFYPSPQVMTTIEFDTDGYFTGVYNGTKLGDGYDAGLSEVTASMGVDEWHTSLFEGKFDITSYDDRGIYNLKVDKLNITSTPGVVPDRPFEAYVDFVPEWDEGDDLMLILPDTELTSDEIVGTQLENFLHPPLDLYPDARANHAYGYILYNKTKDIVFADWEIG